MRLRGTGWPRLIVLALLLAPAALADPRWWWNDAPVGTSGGVTSQDIDVVPPVYRNDPPAIFIAYVRPPGIIEGSLHLAASFDGGCSFCQVHVAMLFAGDVEAAVAAAPLMGAGFYSIQILYTEGFPPNTTAHLA